ncbi:MAG: recombinase family protein [Bacillota bacterium]|jgi:site-specific DNA recombinase
MKIAAAYIRVSTEDQLDYSPDSQIKIIRDYAQKHDLIIPDNYIFIDEGISGRKAEKRPAFMHMISIAKQKPKPFDVILVYALSRFARNREDSVVYKRLLRKELGIDLVSTSQDFGNDKTSILIEALLEAMDEYYSIDLAENVKRGMTEKAGRGQPVSIPALGYEIKNGQYLIDPNSAPVVQMIFKDFIGGMGFRDIAVKLNSLGIITSRGNKFDNRGIEYILYNPVYIGKIRWNPIEKTGRNYNHPDLMITDGGHQPIIDQHTWQEAQKQLTQVKNIYGKYRHSNSSGNFILKGLVKCSNCGSTLVRAAKGSLQCHAYAKGKCNISHSINGAKLKDIVIKKIEADFANINWQLKEKQKFKLTEENTIIERQLEKEQEKLLRIKEAYENGVDCLQEYKINKKRITERIKLLTAKKADISSREPRPIFIERHQDVINIIKDSLIDESKKNRLLSLFIESIIFHRINNELQIFYKV